MVKCILLWKLERRRTRDEACVSVCVCVGERHMGGWSKDVCYCNGILWLIKYEKTVCLTHWSAPHFLRFLWFSAPRVPWFTLFVSILVLFSQNKNKSISFYFILIWDNFCCSNHIMSILLSECVILTILIFILCIIVF